MLIPDVATTLTEAPRLTITRTHTNSPWHIHDEAGTFTAVAANPLREGSGRPDRRSVWFRSAQGELWLITRVSGFRRWAVGGPDGSRPGLITYPLRLLPRSPRPEFQMWDAATGPIGSVLHGVGHGVVVDPAGAEVGTITRHRNHAPVEIEIAFVLPVQRELALLCAVAEIGRTSIAPVDGG